LIPTTNNDLKALSTSFQLGQDDIFCLEITWHRYLPSALELKIETQTQNIISRTYDLFSFVFDWKTRLAENLPFNATYNVTLSFNSLGGVDDVRFCSKTGAVLLFAKLILLIYQPP
jgi:hypothetical protein